MKLKTIQWKELLNHTINSIDFLPTTFIDDENSDNSIPAITNIELICEHKITKVVTKFTISIKDYSYMEDRYTHYKEVEANTLKLLKQK